MLELEGKLLKLHLYLELEPQRKGGGWALTLRQPDSKDFRWPISDWLCFVWLLPLSSVFEKLIGLKREYQRFIIRRKKWSESLRVICLVSLCCPNYICKHRFWNFSWAKEMMLSSSPEGQGQGYLWGKQAWAPQPRGHRRNLQHGFCKSSSFYTTWKAHLTSVQHGIPKLCHWSLRD